MTMAEFRLTAEDLKSQPNSDMSNYSPAGKLQGKVALITGGDSASRSLKKINCKPLLK